MLQRTELPCNSRLCHRGEKKHSLSACKHSAAVTKVDNIQLKGKYTCFTLQCNGLQLIFPQHMF